MCHFLHSIIFFFNWISAVSLSGCSWEPEFPVSSHSFIVIYLTILLKEQRVVFRIHLLFNFVIHSVQVLMRLAKLHSCSVIDGVLKILIEQFRLNQALPPDGLLLLA